MNLFGVSFANPWFLALLLLLLPMYLFYRSPKRRARILFSDIQIFKKIGGGRLSFLHHGSFVFRAIAFSLLVIALARPQSGKTDTKRTSEGLDIILAVDTSGSMRALDFVIDGARQTRLDVIKKVITEFIRNRPDDRIGMVVFGSEAFVQAPLTLDHDVLLYFINAAQIGMAGDKTAIGDGISVSAKRLKDIDAKSKVVILLTDGESNTGHVEPLVAANAAKTLGIKVYTIGVGSKGQVPIQIRPGQFDYVEVSIDEDTLKAIADTTGGKYFFASDTETLREVYNTIDKLEKTKVETKIYRDYDERFSGFLWFALGFLMLELLFGLTRFRRLP